MPAWGVYNFHFLDTVSEQLLRGLDQLELAVLDDVCISELHHYQIAQGTSKGIYVLYYQESPKYLGKADNVKVRLEQHFKKLVGSQNIDVSMISFKSLLLDQSMSTAANEDTLISLYSRNHPRLWNGRGFGPKDQGRNRDTTEPGEFDRQFPIRRDFLVDIIQDSLTLGQLFKAMKGRLPYVFRYQQLPAAISSTELDLAGVPRQAEALLRNAMISFPEGWHAAILSYGMVVYEGTKVYPPGVDVIQS